MTVRTAQRASFLGAIAWVSLCLLVSGWYPKIGATLSTYWSVFGLLGLASAIGLAESVRREMRNNEKLMATLLNEAHTDILTSLSNRRALDQELARRLAQLRRQGTPLSIAFIDIDFFKSINDQYGHQAGDEVLRALANTLLESTRGMDFVARYGGEEFVAVLPGTPIEGAWVVGERIRKATSELQVPYRGKFIKVTVSVGLAEAGPVDENNSLINRADLALYAAKQGGRNACYAHDGVSCRPLRPVQFDSTTTDPFIPVITG